MIKHKLIESYSARHELPLSDPRVVLVDLQYHDIDRRRGLFYKLQDRGLVARVTTHQAIDRAVEVRPQTTRARLRGEFIRRAKERKRDYTVDWVHLKLNDQAQRTVLCKDPFRSHDETRRAPDRQPVATSREILAVRFRPDSTSSEELKPTVVTQVACRQGHNNNPLFHGRIRQFCPALNRDRHRCGTPGSMVTR